MLVIDLYYIFISFKKTLGVSVNCDDDDDDDESRLKQNKMHLS